MIKRIITMALSLTMMIAMGVTSFATDVTSTNCVTFIETEDTVESNARFPGYAGLSYVIASPMVLSTTNISSVSTKVSSTTGRDQNINVTLNSSTRSRYDAISANAYELKIGLNLTDVTRFEVYLNDNYITSLNSYASFGEITVNLADKTPAKYKIVLYDNVTPTQGKILWGNIYYS